MEDLHVPQARAEDGRIGDVGKDEADFGNADVRGTVFSPSRPGTVET